MRAMPRWFFLFFIASLLFACVAPQAVATPTSLPSPPPRTVAHPTVTPYPSPTRAPTWTPEPSATPLDPTLIAQPQDPYSVGTLRARQYGGGQFEVLEELGSYDDFVRYKVHYVSDGLNIYGYVNVPYGNGPYPVIIALAGYKDPAKSKIVDYISDATDALASRGYVVFHPTLRGFSPSDAGPNLYRDGYAVDVLNLIALVRDHAGEGAVMAKVNPNAIGLWGHGLGGAVALKVAVVSPNIKAVVLYAPMSGDEQKNSQYLMELTGSEENRQEMSVPAQEFDAVSADRYYQNIKALVQLHHGSADSVIPAWWSEETCEKFSAAQIGFQCFFYEGAEYTFKSSYLEQMDPRVFRMLKDFLH